MNDLIGKKIKIEWKGKVICSCNKEMDKFYRSGFCYKCYWESPMASQSIFKPELCTGSFKYRRKRFRMGKKISTNFPIMCIYCKLKWNKSRDNTKKVKE